ncbi:cytochrome P450 [Aspergillus eucalypticola CBS 122712]|uniref:Cytochrome P450 n=1 Tax=Aspergillus eucalypticola (strain CBS 122712 / IBT 29274) TaxID=1448314 RepID=A0A317W074_ASPEC|nr:cytochrome P450 [Aspergillus eucalypticola CBS 122712]PWY78991.1 cytochrome P450 [Aspergillus eucalypticola CBS 122712]
MPIPVLVSLALALSFFLIRNFTYKDTALNPKKPFELTSTRVKQEFFFNAQRLLRDWFLNHPNTPVPLQTDVGKLTMLPPDFSRWSMKAFHGKLPGFDGFRENDLTKYLNKVTEPLADETSVAVRELLTDNKEWHTIHLSGVIVTLISRISSRVLLGEKLCRNEECLRITQSYTIDGFLAMTELRMWPAAFYPIVHWFLPRCRKLRSQVSKARKVMQSILEERRQLKEDIDAEGKQSSIFDDAIEWFENAAKGRPYDPVGAQLILSVGAIHTTSDLTCQKITHLVQSTEILESLRKEIADTLQQYGWKKTALCNMKLLDRVVRESQRLKTVTNVSMRRMALKEAHKLWDDDTYENAVSWDGYRTTCYNRPENLAFGHGKHACPGRFFAANEVKIVLIFLLLRYDWTLLEGTVPRIFSGGFGMALDPTLKIEVRRRREGMDI